MPRSEFRFLLRCADCQAEAAGEGELYPEVVAMFRAHHDGHTIIETRPAATEGGGTDEEG